MYFHSQTNLLVTFIINWQYILELLIFSTRISHNFGSEFIGTTNFGGVAKIQPVFTLIFLAELPQNREGFAELAQNLLFLAAEFCTEFLIFCRGIHGGQSNVLSCGPCA